MRQGSGQRGWVVVVSEMVTGKATNGLADSRLELEFHRLLEGKNTKTWAERGLLSGGSPHTREKFSPRICVSKSSMKILMLLLW